jgi:hypothetical protein
MLPFLLTGKEDRKPSFPCCLPVSKLAMRRRDSPMGEPIRGEINTKERNGLCVSRVKNTKKGRRYLAPLHRATNTTGAGKTGLILQFKSRDLRVELLVIRDQDCFDGKRVIRNQRTRLTYRSPSACERSYDRSNLRRGRDIKSEHINT